MSAYSRCAVLVFMVVTTLGQFKEDRAKEFWDFSHVDYTSITFPDSFEMGAGVAAHQVDGAEGCPDSNWAYYESAFNLEPSGNGCDFRNRCFDDIELMKEIGLTSFRFSVDWSLAEPKQGEYSQEYLDYCELFCKKLLENGIKPVVTLHHFSHPQWFELLGAFEKEENIMYFVDFSKHVFNHLHQYVHMWCTINEPSIYIFGGYIRAQSPPGKGFPPGIRDFKKAGRVLGNLLKSHVAVYNELKSLPQGDRARIGIVHQMMPFKPFHNSLIQGSLEKYAAYILNHMINDAVMNFFKTGEYHFYFPHKMFGLLSFIPGFVAHEYFSDSKALTALDFFGINYYSHILISINFDTTFSEAYHPHDIKTDMPYGFYPEGIYHAIVKASELGVPLYITENGIADAQDTKRALWIERHLYAVSKAIEDGYNVKGFFYWSLLDNYEWDLGYSPKFGLYAVDRETQQRTLKEGAKVFQYIATRKA